MFPAQWTVCLRPLICISEWLKQNPPARVASCLMDNILFQTEKRGMVNSQMFPLPSQTDCHSSKIDIISIDSDSMDFSMDSNSGDISRVRAVI